MIFEAKGHSSDIGEALPEISELKDTREQLMVYVKENEILAKELSNLRHYILNMVQGINGYIEFGDYTGLKEYIDDILEKSRLVTDTNFSSLGKIKNLCLRELLSAGLKRAASTGIDFKLMVDKEILIKNELIKENDLCKAAGEFLENAFEAASEAYNKKISIYIFTSGNAISIIIESTFKEEPDKYFLNTGASIVRGDRGQELELIGDMLSGYPHILNNSFIQHQVFVQELQIII